VVASVYAYVRTAVDAGAVPAAAPVCLKRKGAGWCGVG